MGVELGKELAKNLLPSVQSNGSEQLCYDESTNKLIQTVFDFKN